MDSGPIAARTAPAPQGCWLLPRGTAAIARTVPEPAAFVVRALDLAHAKALPTGLPRPIGAEWINRGTGQPLRPTTVAMLLRTLPRRQGLSASAEALHASTGLRLAFASPEARHRFAHAWLALAGQI